MIAYQNFRLLMQRDTCVPSIYKVSLLIIYLCYAIPSLYGQDYYPEDSLNQLHQRVILFSDTKQSDSVLFYNTLLSQKYKWNFKKSLKSENDKLLLTHGLSYINRLQDHVQDFSKVVEISNTLLPKAIKQKDTLALVDLYITMGESYHDLNDYVQSVLYLNEAMHVLDTTIYKKEAFKVYFQLGISTSHFNKDQAIAYYYQAEHYLSHVDDEMKYNFYAKMTSILPNFPLEHVLKYFEKEKKYGDLEVNRNRALHYYNNLAYAYLENGKVKKAKTLLKTNLPWCNIHKNFKGCEDIIYTQYVHTLGAIERELGNYDLALKCFDMALEEAKADKDYENAIFYSKEIADLCKDTKNYKKGLEVLIPLSAYRDSLSLKDIEKDVKSAQNERLLNREKVVVEALTEENSKINVTVSRLTVALYILVLVVGGVTYLNILSKLRQIKIKEALNLNQLQNLTAAMNPHFLFNSFSTLQNLILNKNTIKANTYMANLARLIRHFFYAFEHIDIPFQKEIEILESYCELEAMRQNEAFTYNITLAKGLEDDIFLIPSMLIQPIVENAFKHAFSEKNKVYTLQIKFKEIEHGNYILCSIKDNGIGREAAERDKQVSKHLSISSRNLDTRLKIIQKQLKKKAEMRIVDLVGDNGQPKGTEVILILPKMY